MMNTFLAQQIIKCTKQMKMNLLIGLGAIAFLIVLFFSLLVLPAQQFGIDDPEMQTFLFGSIALLGLGTVLSVKLIENFRWSKNPESHPLFARLQSLGDPAQIAYSFESELAHPESFEQHGPVSLTRSYIVWQSGQNQSTAIHLYRTDEVVGITTQREPINPKHAPLLMFGLMGITIFLILRARDRRKNPMFIAKLYTRDGKALPVRMPEDQALALAASIQNRCPFGFQGSTSQWQWKWLFQKQRLIQEAEMRKAYFPPVTNLPPLSPLPSN